MLKIPQAPLDLKKPTREWWRSVVSSYDLQAHHVKLLTLAARAWDRAEQASEDIREHGLVYLDRYKCPKVRPEVHVERDARSGFARMIREMGLDLAEVEVPRPGIVQSKRRIG